MAFSPDSSKLASASFDGAVRVWALDLDHLIDVANRKLTRGLTEEECRQYLHRRPVPPGEGGTRACRAEPSFEP